MVNCLLKSRNNVTVPDAALILIMSLAPLFQDTQKSDSLDSIKFHSKHSSEELPSL